MQFSAITWNLFHGRDAPPDRSLLTTRSRLFRITERNETHVQVNRSLLPEFARMIARAEWDVALLQECPPRYLKRLAEESNAEAHRALTSRNQLGALRAALAKLNPDEMASGEGGSNTTLLRRGTALGAISDRRELVIRERDPERRVMAFTQTTSGLCVANLHATNDRPELSYEELINAARVATAWAGEAPLLFGGDFNLRPGRQPEAFDRLAEEFGLAPPTAPGSLDHLLIRGAEVADPPTAWPPEDREIEEDGLALRLSDHAPVSARFELG